MELSQSVKGCHSLPRRKVFISFTVSSPFRQCRSARCMSRRHIRLATFGIEANLSCWSTSR